MASSSRPVLLVYLYSILMSYVCYTEMCLQMWTGLFPNNAHEGYEPLPIGEVDGDLFVIMLNKDGFLAAKNNDVFLFYCKSGFKNSPAEPIEQTRSQVCSNGTFLYPWSTFICKGPTDSVMRRSAYTSKCASSEEYWKTYITILDVPYSVYGVCFDRSTLSTTSVYYKTHMGAIKTFYTENRPYDRWLDTQYGSFLVAKAYTIRQQYLNIAATIPNGLSYWTDNYLQRGHLVTFAVFDYFTFRNATCQYLNNSPQWASINQGNIRRVENILSALSSDLQHRIRIRSASLGQLVLSTDFPIALFRDTNTSLDLVKVPAYITKEFKHPVEQKVFIVYISNNPFLEQHNSPPTLPFTCDYVGDSYAWWPEHLFRTNVADDVWNGYTWLCAA